jgi:IPT/TIG domain
MSGIDWESVDATAQRDIDPSEMTTAIMRGVTSGDHRFRRRLAFRWVLAAALVLALVATSFVIRAAVHGEQAPASASAPEPPTTPHTGTSTSAVPVAPVVQSITPAGCASAGGTYVTIRGAGLTGATAVTFGAERATKFTIDSDTKITAITAPGTGTVDVTVTTPAGTSPTGLTSARYTYPDTSDRPVLLSVSPNTGPASGGTLVTIAGTCLTGVTEVRFGEVNATEVNVVSDTRITVTSPPTPQRSAAQFARGDTHAEVYVIVQSPAGTSKPGPEARYTYIFVPTPTMTTVPPTTTSAPTTAPVP